MIRLPKVFYHFDKELHAIFYFSAALIISLLLSKKWIHISVALILFGIIIELAQEYSNKISFRLIGKAIHGRFDIEDVKYNIIGLFIGVLFFHLIRITANFKKTI